MLSAGLRAISHIKAFFYVLRRYAPRIVAAVFAAQAAVVAVLVTLAELRKRRDTRPEGFPWEPHPEISLESKEVWFKIFPQGEELFEAMLEEIEKAEREIFIETFIWKNDRVGKRFVEALARKAREGVRVYAIFDGLANFIVVVSVDTPRIIDQSTFPTLPPFQLTYS